MTNCPRSSARCASKDGIKFGNVRADRAFAQLFAEIIDIDPDIGIDLDFGMSVSTFSPSKKGLGAVAKFQRISHPGWKAEVDAWTVFGR